jgi:hypothetical protein
MVFLRQCQGDLRKFFEVRTNQFFQAMLELQPLAVRHCAGHPGQVRHEHDHIGIRLWRSLLFSQRLALSNGIVAAADSSLVRSLLPLIGSPPLAIAATANVLSPTAFFRIKKYAT